AAALREIGGAPLELVRADAEQEQLIPAFGHAPGQRSPHPLRRSEQCNLHAPDDKPNAGHVSPRINVRPRRADAPRVVLRTGLPRRRTAKRRTPARAGSATSLPGRTWRRTAAVPRRRRGLAAAAGRARAHPRPRPPRR